jgi:hypothetical protein
MKFNRFIASLLALLLLIVLGACGNNNTLTSVYPNIAQSGASASVKLSLPSDMKIDSANESAKLYELTIDEAESISQIERCLDVDLSTMEKTTYELGTIYTIGNYQAEIDNDGYWFYEMIDYPPFRAGLSMSDDEAIEIAKSFVEENGLWPGGVDNIQVADQTGMLDDGSDGLKMKTVYLYPSVDGKTVLGVYRISIDVNLEGEILSVYCLANPTGTSTEVALKSRAQVAADVENENYSASFTSNLTNAKITSCELGYYADGVEHNGKTYLFPVYVMIGEGTNANGEKETFDIIIDALK